MADFKRLEVWRRAHALALSAHDAATSIRGQRYASLRSQIIRSAMSVPANIVEGREQVTESAFARFLRIAIASLSELEYHLLAAKDIEVIASTRHAELSKQLSEVRMMLYGLLRRLKTPSNPQLCAISYQL